MAVVIQAGHVNIQQNANEGLRGETGAPGEAQYVSEIAAAVAGALQAHGLVCIIADANFNSSSDAGQPYQVFVALHCDGRNASGFAVGVETPAEDGAAADSAKLADALRSEYSASTMLTDLSTQFESDKNITEYYMWKALNSATPCALIELGAIASSGGGAGPDKDYLESHRYDVANGVVNGVLTFLGIPATVEAQSSSTDAAPVPPGETSASVPTPAEVSPATDPLPLTTNTPSDPKTSELPAGKIRSLLQQALTLLNEVS